MSIYITIDGGTTNTRISLVEDKKIIDRVKLNVGARAGIGDCNILKNEIRNGIKEIIRTNNLDESKIARILASGMITSEFGLCNLEHINTPAGIFELHESMHETVLKDVSDIPFVFIRGVKMMSDSFENTDIMRGEETELMGIINEGYGKCIYVLPGSHSKIIKTDEMGRIAEFSTMLTGEMIASLSEYTILKDAVNLKESNLDEEFLLKGYDFCKKEGINKALFKTRILKNTFKCEMNKTYSFFVGTILCGEIEQIVRSDVKTVVIGGKSQIKNAMAVILKNRDDKEIICLEEDVVEFSTVLGAVRIFEN